MKEYLEFTNVTLKVKNPRYDAGSKVIRIPFPKPKQRGWRRMIQGDEIVYVRRRWKKSTLKCKE